MRTPTSPECSTGKEAGRRGCAYRTLYAVFWGSPYRLTPRRSLKGKRVEKLPPPQKVAVDFIEDGFLANAGSLIPYCRDLLTAGLKNGGILERAANMVCHASTRTAQVYIGEHYPGRYKGKARDA